MYTNCDVDRHNNSWHPRGGQAFRGRGLSTRSRGGVAVHRNRTLVLNSTNSAQPADTAQADTVAADVDSSTGPPSNGWVSKRDRHMQLINTNVYEQHTHDKMKAIEESRKRKLHQRDLRERSKIARHFQINSAHDPKTASSHEVNVQGIRFQVAQGGSKLMRVSGTHLLQADHYDCAHNDLGDEHAAKATPKSTVIGGVTFHRSKNGNLYREGIVKAQRYGPSNMCRPWLSFVLPRDADFCRKPGGVKKIDEPCRDFTSTGICSYPNYTCHTKKSPRICSFEVRSRMDVLTFDSLGSCVKGPKCRYIHDPTKVAICKTYLQKGSCPLEDACDLSHDATPERSPACMHFARGHCSNEKCLYSHVHVSPTAPVCRAFGIYGYCEKGSTCNERHVNECPDFSNTGVCNTKGCRLMHRHKAAVIRKSAAAENDQSSDLSSDDDYDEIGSDDVDSEEIEFIGDGDSVADSDIMMQRGFVHL